jgi:hypothetical protein
MFSSKNALSRTHKKEKVLKKTEFRCFSLTITYGKIGQRTFKEDQKKQKNIEQEEEEKKLERISYV